ncbi:MAG: hypothetical protein O3A63_10040 [Proteobacteria bacterium]|nr:hypothetical protein [Pseudomonadota bacterium]
MTRQLNPLCYLLALLACTMTMAVSAKEMCGDDDDDDDELPLSVAEIYAELNHTDGDLGIHGLIDGDAWKRLTILDPYERRMARVNVTGRLRRQGLTELFFESAEPPFDELSPKAFFARFPEGCYEVEAKSLENEELEGETFFSHIMPAPPANLAVNGYPAALDCDEYVPVIEADYYTLSWDPVTTHHPYIGKHGDVEIVQYQAVVEFETEDEHGEEVVYVYNVELPPEVTSVTVPPEFMALGDEFKYELVVREGYHNQTALESCFRTSEEEEED